MKNTTQTSQKQQVWDLLQRPAMSQQIADVAQILRQRHLERASMHIPTQVVHK